MTCFKFYYNDRIRIGVGFYRKKEKERSVIGMKKILFLFSIVFAILTFVGAGYVLINKGTVNAGYAVIPMMISFACSNSFIDLKNKAKLENQ